MSNIQAAQPAAHSVPNSNGGQPQYIAPVDHVPQMSANPYPHPHPYSSNPAERSGYTMQLPQGTHIYENRIQTGNGNHNVVTVIPQPSLHQMRGQPPRMPLMGPQGPQGHPQQASIPYSSAPNAFYYSPMYSQQFMAQQFQIPTSEQTAMNPMGYMMPVNVPPPNIAQFPQQQMAPAPQNTSKPKRERNILKIMDPQTQQVINETEIAASKPSQEATVETKPAAPANAPSTSESTNINQQFVRAVSARAVSGFNNENKGQSESEATAETRSSSVTPSVELNDNKNETSKVASDHSIPTDQLNGQLEKTEAKEEREDSERPEETQLVAENDSTRKETENEIEHVNEPEFKENEASLIEELDKKLQQCYDTQKESIDNKVYDKDFLQVIREIVGKLNKNGDLVKPLKSEEELKEMGIDQAGMPAIIQSSSRERARKDIGSRQDVFMPAFGSKQEGQPRNLTRPQHYGGRLSGKKDQQRKPPQVIARPSITRQPIVETLRKAENAWKPSLGKNDPHEKKRKEIRGLLNKITPSTFGELSTEFLDKKVYEDESTLPMIVDLIFDKAVEEPKFCGLYSNLCRMQTEEEQKVNSARPFRQAIIKKCQTTFEKQQKNSTEEAMESIRNEIEEENKKEAKDENKLKELNERLEELLGKEKRRMLGTIRFIGELYRHMLITDNIIQWCSVHLIKQYQNANDDVFIEYVVQLIETVGPIHEKRTKPQLPANPATPQQFLSQILGHLQNLQSQVSTRVKFMIMNLEDLKSNNWVPRHGDTGPKTKAEVRNEVLQEELKNEEERKDYEKKQQQQQYNRDYDRRQRPAQYGGRGSLDSGKFPGDQKRIQAAAASSQASSNTLRKDTSLKSAIDASGPLKKTSWASGSAGGGGGFNAGNASSKPPTKTIHRYGGRGSENVASQQSTSREQHSRSSTPKPNERKGGPLMSKASSEDPALPEAMEHVESAESEEIVPEKPVPNMEEILPRMKTSVKLALEEHIEGVADDREACDNIKRHCTSPALSQAVFSSIFDFAITKFKPHEDDKRAKIGTVFRRALQEKELKSDAIQGVINYINGAIQDETHIDVPQIWKYIAYIIVSSILSEEVKEEGVENPSLHDFTPVFDSLSKNEDFGKPFELFILVLRGMMEFFRNKQADADLATLMAMTFDEVKEDPFYKSPGLEEALRSVTDIGVNNYENLLALLNS